MARLLASVGLARHRGDAARPVRDHRTPPAGRQSRDLWGHRRLLTLRRARGDPDYLRGDGLRHLPVGRGPGFPLDEGAHAVVLALPRGALVDAAPPDRGPIPAAGHPRRPTRVLGDLVRDVPQPGRHLRHSRPSDRFALRRPVLRLSSSFSRPFRRARSTATTASVTTGIAPVSLRNSGRTWIGLSTASSPASCTSSSWRP